MSTITLEVPDELAAFLTAMDPETRNRFAVAALERQREVGDDEIDPEMVADLEIAIQEAETDPGMPLDDAFDLIRANLRARFPAPAA